MIHSFVIGLGKSTFFSCRPTSTDCRGTFDPDWFGGLLSHPILVDGKNGVVMTKSQPLFISAQVLYLSMSIQNRSKNNVSVLLV